MTIMNFIEKARSLSLGQKVASAADLLGAACMVSLLFGTVASVAQAPTNPTAYVGIWKMASSLRSESFLFISLLSSQLTV
jgi:hypothetical protein